MSIELQTVSAPALIIDVQVTRGAPSLSRGIYRPQNESDQNSIVGLYYLRRNPNCRIQSRLLFRDLFY
jgi:hypothetical protein